MSELPSSSLLTSWWPGHRRPRALLSTADEAALGARHREVLDQLEALFLERGFAELTVAELSATIGCSRRTLYELAPSKEQLVLIVVDRFFHRSGRRAVEAIDPRAPVGDQLRTYVGAGMAELERVSAAFDHDLEEFPPTRRLSDHHNRFVQAVLEELLTVGVARGEFRPGLDLRIVSRLMVGAYRQLTRSEELDDLGVSREQALSAALEVILAGLRAG